MYIFQKVESREETKQQGVQAMLASYTTPAASKKLRFAGFKAKSFSSTAVNCAREPDCFGLNKVLENQRKDAKNKIY